MKKYLLTLDNGGTYIKAALIDFLGNQIAITKVHNGMIHGRAGQAEFDLDKLWEKNCQCIRTLFERTCVKASEVACIGFAGQGKGLYMVDKDGRCYRNAIASSDTRADSCCQQWIAEGISERIYHKTYQLPMAAQTAPILRWVKDHEPENYKRLGWVFSMKDYLFFRMTGTLIAGRGCQSGTNLVNLNTAEYDDDLLEIFGITEVKDKLPELKYDCELCGYVSDTAAWECGCEAGTPVAAGMFDVDAAALAMGVLDPEDLFVIMGTCGINCYISPKPVMNYSVTYNSLYPLEGMYLIQEGSNASSSVLEWVIKILYGRQGDEGVYEEINKLVKSVSPESCNLIFIPALNGFTHACTEGTLDMRGAWIGLSPEHSRAEMLRAVYEGVVFTHMLEIKDLLKNRERPKKIRVSGGAAHSEVRMQMFADALQIPLQIIPEGELGNLGVAISSAVASGVYGSIREAVKAMVKPGEIIIPNQELAEIYKVKYDNFCKIMDLSLPMWTVLKR